MTVGVFMSGASMVLQAGIGITIFVGAILLTSGQIGLIPLLMFLLMVTRIYGPILSILANLSSLLIRKMKFWFREQSQSWLKGKQLL